MATRTDFSRSLVGLIISLRWPFLVILAGLTVLAGVLAAQVGVDNAVEIWFLDDDPTLVSYHDFQESFGNDEVVAIAVANDPLSAEGLSRLRALDDAASAIDGIGEVRSPASAVGISGDAGTLEVGTLLPAGAISPEDAAKISTQLRSDPLMRPLVSSDGELAMVLARMEALDDIDARRDGILAQLRAQLDAIDGDLSYAGIGVIYAALNDASTRGAAVFIVASYLLIAVLLWRLFGRIGPTLLTLIAVGVAASGLMGVYASSGRDINMVTMVLPTLVLVIGVSSCVHMLVHVADQDPSLTGRARTIAGVGFVFWPCLFNTLTTCMGFLALGTAAMPVIRDLGYFGAVGLALAFVVGLLLCSSLAPMRFFQPANSNTGRIQRMVDGLANLAVTRSRAVLVVAAFAALIAALGITRIQVDTYSIDFLRASHPVRVDSERIEAGYGAYTPLEFVVRAEAGVKTPEVLGAVAAWQDRMAAHPDVGWSHSAADVVRRLNEVLTGDGPEARVVPADPFALDQLLFLYDSSPDADLSALIAENDAAARITVGIPMGSAQRFQRTISELEALAQLPEGVTLTASGYLPLYVQMMDYIVRSQLTSFGLAFLIIFALVGLLFGSLRMAMISIPANLLPVLMTLGLMGILGIRLDVATVTIAAIVLGLVVDDTVQFLYRYRHERSRHRSEAEAVSQAVRVAGRPMAITTIVLALGFCVLGLASVKSVAWFGLLLAFALVSALLSDLLVIPAFLVMLGEEDAEEAA
ncbi:MAG: MMPL family transporter [Myxococcota bacterium]|nr:MMPL family transporter [Myxococcota bacterium]